ncbi:MAG TPA: transcriptional repressor, partial [bacterium]|nr:transcriptional repressor [bacterium]
MRYGNPWLKERLAAEGFRNTESRRIILDILSKTSRHLSAEDIYFIVRGINPSIGFATVYRTLDLLTRMGIVQKFDFGEGRSRYELIENRKKDS